MSRGKRYYRQYAGYVPQYIWKHSDSRVYIFKDIHGCEQEPAESIVSYAGKVEELCYQAVELHAIQRSQHVLLKNVM